MKKTHLAWGSSVAALSLIGYGINDASLSNNGASIEKSAQQDKLRVERLLTHIEQTAKANEKQASLEPVAPDVAEKALVKEVQEARFVAPTKQLIEAVREGRSLKLSLAGVERSLMLSPKKVFAEGAKVRQSDGRELFDANEDFHVFGGAAAPAVQQLSEKSQGVRPRAEAADTESVPHAGMSPNELLASFDAKATTLTMVGDQYTLALRNAQRDHLFLRNSPTTGGLEMRYEPESMHKEAFGECASGKCDHDHNHQEAHGMDEAIALSPEVEPAVSEQFDQWIALDQVAAGIGLQPGEKYQAINTTPGIDPLTRRGNKGVDPIPFGEKYNESLQEFQYWAQTGPDLLSGDKENPTEADIAAMLTRILITFEEIDEIYERNMATKMLVAELMIRRENDGGVDKSTIMHTWRNGGEPIVAHGNFYGWGGGGGAAGNSFSISSWPVGAAHELGHVLSMGHSDGGDLMGPGGGPAHFWSYLTPGPHSKPITAHQLWREFSGRASLRTRGLKEHGQVDGESDSDLRTANGSNRLRHPAETAFANDDTVVTTVDTAVEFDPLTNDDRSTPGSPFYNEDLVIEEVSRIVPAGAGTLEITEQGKKLKFTPTQGFEGSVHFNYTLRGSVGNNGRGWLSRAPISITVGSPTNDPNTIDIAAGQDQWTIFPANLTHVDTPTKSNIFVSGDQLLLRAHPDATGTEQFTLNIGGTEQEVTVNYGSPSIAAVDDLIQTDGGRVVRFNPLVNDQVTGQLRNEWNITTVVKEAVNTATEKQTDFARSYVLESATLDTPAMGSLELETRFHIFPDGTTGPGLNGFLRFTPADGASGYAVISYTAKDVDGRVLNGTARVLVGLADVVRPARPYTRVRQDHGIVLDSQKLAATGGDFTGTSTLLWEVVNQPAGAVVNLSDATTENAVAHFDTPGRYRLRLSATDNGHTKTVDRWVIVEAEPFELNQGEERAPWATVNHKQLSGWNQSNWNTSELVTSINDDKFQGLIDLAPAGTATRSDGNNAEAQTLVNPSEYHAFTQYYNTQNGEFGTKGAEAWWELDLGAEVPVQWVDVHLALSALEDSDYGRYGLVTKLLAADRSEIKSQKLLLKSEHHFAHRIPVSLAGEQTVRYVRIEKPAALNTLSLWEVRVMGYRDQDADLTVTGKVSQSTTPDSDFDAYKAVDKLRGGINGSRTDTTTEGNWWELTLDEESSLSQIRLHLETAMSGGTVTAYNAAGTQTWQTTLDGNVAQLFDSIPANTLAKRVRVELPSGLTNASGDKAVRINECWVWGEKDLATTTEWSQVSGPASASFADASALQTGVTLPSNGDYTLRLTSDDGWNKTVRDFVVNYDSASTGPQGLGLNDLDLATAGGGSNVDLYAAFQDAETADSSMTYQVVSVTNGAIFNGDQTGAIADPANFSLSTLAGASGSSVVTIRATDGNGNSTDLSFTVNTANQAPVVPDVLEVIVPELTPTSSVLVDLAQHVTDADGDNLTFTVHDDLINRRYNGVLSLAADGKLSLVGELPVVDQHYSAGTLLIEVNDGVNLLQKFTVQLTIEDENRAPEIVAATVPVSETAVLGSAFYVPSLGANNDPSDSYQWEIIGGNEAGDWSIDPDTGGLIPLQVLDASRIGQYDLVVRATDNGVPPKSGTATITVQVGLQGLVNEDYFADISGTTIADLTGNASYPDNPTSRRTVNPNGFHFPSDGNDFGRRVRGYLSVPETGDYTFHLASDDHGQFSLSSDESAANAVNIVSLSGYTGELNFDATSSAAISLVAGQRYYFEALHKEGGGGDHIAMGWSGPSGLTKTLIASEYIEPLEDFDQDGLDDWWELTYIGNLDADGAADTDQDGLTNAQELLAHTHPLISARAEAWQELVDTVPSIDQSSIEPLAGNTKGSVDLTNISGDATYEFFVNAEDLSQTGVELLAGNGWAIKLEQWNNRGVVGLTKFGSADWSFSAESGQSVATPYGVLTHVAVVVDSQQSQSRLYFNGVHVGTLGQVPDFAASAISVGSSNLRDDAENGVYAFAAYNAALDVSQLLNNHAAWMGNSAPVLNGATFAVSEAASIGLSLGTITAIDADAGDTLSYQITSGNEDGKFTISSSGEITTAGLLDFDTTASYSLLVQVTDNGNPAKSDTALVTVNVTNENEAPSLANVIAEITENGAAGDAVATLSGTDPDPGDSLTFAITAGNSSGLFAIDAAGNVTTTAALDFESVSQHILTVSATDVGGLSDSASLTINVLNSDAEDTDGDGVEDSQEIALGLLKDNVDSDNDGANDGFEIQEGTDPLNVNDTPALRDSLVSIDIQGDGSSQFWGNTSDPTEMTGQLGLTGLGNIWNIFSLKSFDGNPPSNYDQSPSLSSLVDTDGGVTRTSMTVLGKVTAWSGTDPNATGDTMLQQDCMLLKAIGADESVTLTLAGFVPGETYTLHFFCTSAQGHYDVDFGAGPTRVTEASAAVVATADNAGRLIGTVSTPAEKTEADIAGIQIVGKLSADMVSVPNLAGMTQAQAEAALATAGFTSSFTEDFSESVVLGNVISNSSQGVTAVAGSEIALVISKGSQNTAPVASDATLAVVENSSAGTVVGTVTATDANVLSYAITAGNAGGEFSINSSTGEITTTTVLDHEVTASYVLTVTVTDDGTPSLSDTATITVNVSNANEGPTANDAAGNVAENLAGGQAVASVTASDPDAGDSLGYAITAGNGSGLFAIDSSGNVTTTGSLDYESASQHVLTVTVTDGGSLTDTAIVTVNVSNANEAPVANDAAGSVAENGSASAVATVSASDPDAGASLSYAITAGNGSGLFAIDSSGNVTTTGALDFESASQHVLTVSVSDGSLSDTAQVTVTTTNVNESPVASDVAGNVDENASAGAAVATVPASDPDAGSSLIYTITAGNAEGLFAIDSSGNITATAALDFENASQYALTVTVSDGTLSDTSEVTVNVNDVNEDPVFAADTMNRDDVLEARSYTGQTLAGSATDVDAATTLEYSKTAGPAWLSVATDGTLTGTPGSSDLGVNVFTVQVSDGNGGTDTATLNVEVLDKLLTTSFASYWSSYAWSNAIDGDPATFAWASRTAQVDDHMTVEYGQPVGPGIVEVLTGDPGNGGDSLVSGVMETSNDGVTWTNVATFSGGEAQANLTEAVKFVRLRCTASQGAWLKVREFVLPSNAAPVANGAIFALAENSSNGTAVGSVTAADANVGDTLSYAITAGNDSNIFAIDASGNITTAAALDFETTAQHVLTVTVTDDGMPAMSDTATVTVDVTDANEAPVANDNSGTLAEDVTIGTAVATVSASDVDAGDSHTFAITAGNTGNAFAIDNSGNITTAAGLDFETTASYTLTVEVTDSGSLTDTAAVNVTVTDVVETTAPVVATGSASNIAMTTADLGYSITDDGGESPSVTLYYGETDGGTTPGNWASSVAVGAQATGAYIETLTGLTEGTSYYFTIAATNSVATTWGSTGSFATTADTSPKMVRTTVNSVSSTNWTTVDLGQNYNSAVIVATPIYADSTQVPVVTRIRNVSGSSFDLKLDRADGLTADVTCNVSVVAVEEGVYTLATDGVQMEAVKYTSTITADNGNWSAEAQIYTNSYTAPVVVGQVMSANDANWSVFWSMGNTRTAPASASVLNVGKHVGEDPNIVRVDETIGYIVIESGSGSINGVAYEAALGADSVRGFGNSTNPYTYSLSGNLASASAAALSISGMDGNNGAWAVLSGATPLTPSTLSLHASEDMVNDSETSHTTTQVGYIIFE